jgi:ATPase family associated with various cellular activities (AAA)
MDKSAVITAVILGLSGLFVMNIKQLFNFVWTHFLNLFIYTLKVEESSRFFYVLQKYIFAEKNDKLHNFYYRNIYDDFIEGENKKITFMYNFGYFFIKVDGNRILVSKYNEALTNSMTPYKNTKQILLFYSLKKQPLIDLAKYVDEKYGNNRIKYFFNDQGEVKLLGNIINKTFNNIFLNGNLKNTIISDLDKFNQSKLTYEKHGLKYKRVYFFYGEAGTGKSSLSIAIANYCKRNILAINASKDMTDATLIKLISNRPDNSIILFEDIDCLFEDLNREIKEEKSDKPVVNIPKITLSCILNILDGAYTPNDVIFILTTNHIDKLDNALKRDGRTDMLLEITKPTYATKEQYVTYIKQHNKSKENVTIDITGDVTLSTLEKELLN